METNRQNAPKGVNRDIGTACNIEIATTDAAAAGSNSNSATKGNSMNWKEAMQAVRAGNAVVLASAIVNGKYLSYWYIAEVL